jgi:hypothetical protein
MKENPDETNIIQGHWRLISRVVPCAVVKAAEELPNHDPRKSFAQQAASEMAIDPEVLFDEADDAQQQI